MSLFNIIWWYRFVVFLEFLSQKSLCWVHSGVGSSGGCVCAFLDFLSQKSLCGVHFGVLWLGRPAGDLSDFLSQKSLCWVHFVLGTSLL